MQERRAHKRFPVIKDLAEPIEISVLNDQDKIIKIPGVLTNFSAGGMVLVLMGSIQGKPSIQLSFHLPGFDRFVLEGQVRWTKPKGVTEILGLQFTNIDKDHQRQINHMAEAYDECEARIKEKAATICFHGCAFWDLCEKSQKLKTVNGLAHANGKSKNGKKTGRPKAKTAARKKKTVR